jgi:adenine C2-methylase RlmN of 23S rRNA A2503 and tRNA A37
LKDAKGDDIYQKLATYLKNHEELDSESIQELYKESSIYVLKEVKEKESKKEEIKRKFLEETTQEFDARWWKEQNNKCIDCTRKCKQSGKADVIYCSDYERKE